MAADPSEALFAQSALIRDWLAQLPYVSFGLPSVLPGWDVRVLTGHVLMVHRGLQGALQQPTDAAPLALHDYVARYRPDHEQIDAMTLQLAADRTPDDLLTELDLAVQDLRGRLAEPLPKVVVAPRGPVTAADYLSTRVIELLAHAEDLSRSLPDRAP
ncbi:MAG: hypothetical protein QOI26_1341, partial [Pseudonocardiales bacterium]|nr:hypothetical protein [Pseudonocardiales bacterium]